MILDRFAIGLSDPQEMVPAASCDGCGCELFPGDAAFEHDGELLCSAECVVAYLVGVGALTDLAINEKMHHFCWGRK